MPPVHAWQEQITLPTYGVGRPDKNPMFFEKRIYQGSSGAVYPHPVIEKIEDEKHDRQYTALFVENEYIKVMVLPELGGRIQMAYDKLKDRHFIYYNQVVKPALVGLTGPWVSGGIEFNWPQHHRPSTFDPIDFSIEEHADGSRTVWVNEVERMFGTKGMAGFTLHPGRAYIEIKAKLFNRTSLPQTFLWWANPAVKVNDHYQSVFPPDVNAVFDHGKRDVSTFPIATGTYYKVDYSPGTDISRYRNIPVPTSYMAIRSEYDFVGGYEHDTRAGVLHVANHHISPGKKQWTWGHSDFGQAWDRNLTDEDGPYIELMTGVFTDNQPDFSWIMPYEEKTFTQYFLPYRELGVIKNASKDILLNVEIAGAELSIGVFATAFFPDCRIILVCGGSTCLDEVIILSPEQPFLRNTAIPAGADAKHFRLKVLSKSGRELLSYDPSQNKENDLPEPAAAASDPGDTSSNEQLFLTGQHLEQYRHATYSPVPYYEEALKRDPKDIRCNNALGSWYLRRGKFAQAVPYFEAAIATATSRNPNPYDGEPYYNLGTALNYMGQQAEAYDAFYKASWSIAWQAGAYFALALIDVSRGDLEQALENIQLALDRNGGNGRARVILCGILRRLGRFEDTIKAADTALERDAFNLGVLFEKARCLENMGDTVEAGKTDSLLISRSRQTENNLSAYALDLAAAGWYEDALQLLGFIPAGSRSPMYYYYSAWFIACAGNIPAAKELIEKAEAASAYLCFPNRLEDIPVLEFAIKTGDATAKAAYYLGNLWYDKRQYAEAIESWERSVALSPDFATVHRNLGIAYFNKKNDAQRALQSFEKAFSLDTSDARVLMELDQLSKRMGRLPAERLAYLESHLPLVLQRDDLYLERLALINFLGRHKDALQLISERKFHPWEGGEGKVSGQYIFSLVEQAKSGFFQGRYPEAIAQLEAATVYPVNLGEGKLYGAKENDIEYWLGCCYEALGRKDLADPYFERAATGPSEPGEAVFYNDQQPDKIFYQGLAHRKLGDEARADALFSSLSDYGKNHSGDKIRIDYFAVSLPNLLVFDDDLDLRNRIHCGYISGLGLAGLGRMNEAVAELQQVLLADPMHFGARQHLSLFQQAGDFERPVAADINNENPDT